MPKEYIFVNVKYTEKTHRCFEFIRKEINKEKKTQLDVNDAIAKIVLHFEFRVQYSIEQK